MSNEPKRHFNNSQTNNLINEGLEVLSHKLKYLQQHDKRYGTNIIASITPNIKSIDDVLVRNLSGCGMNSLGKHVANEVESVTNIYADLLASIASNQSGCGALSNENSTFDSKEMSKFKRDFVAVCAADKNAKKRRSGSKKKRSGSKRSLVGGLSLTSSRGEGFGMTESLGNSAVDLTMAARRRRSKKKATGSKKKAVGSKRMASKNNRKSSGQIVF